MAQERMPRSGPIRAPLARRWRVARGVVIPILVVWSVVAAITIFPGPLVSAIGGIVAGSDEPADRPSAEACQEYAAEGRVPVTGHSDPDGTMRVFAVQYQVDLDHVRSYETYRTAMRCLMETLVEPYRRPGQPTLVVFPADIGLSTLAIGQRGATVRAQDDTWLRAPFGSDASVGIGSAALQLTTAYAAPIAGYQARFGLVDPRKQLLLAATDTFVRAFVTTFSEIAIEYDVYVVAGNTQADYRETSNPLEIALYADPSVLPTSTAYVATSDRVTSSTYLWGPDVVNSGPDGTENLLVQHDSLVVNSGLVPADAGAAGNAGSVEIEGFTVGFAAGDEAFQYGYALGSRLPSETDACADLASTYVPCLDELGVDLLINPAANPAPWAWSGDGDSWRPLTSMGASWRAVADPTVNFRYAVSTTLTGNAMDVAYDGQSAIVGRDSAGPGGHYAGADEFQKGDFAEYQAFIGPRDEFLALAPWVADGDRDALARTADALLPGSGDDQEGSYVESAIFADLLPPSAAQD